MKEGKIFEENIKWKRNMKMIHRLLGISKPLSLKSSRRED